MLALWQNLPRDLVLKIVPGYILVDLGIFVRKMLPPFKEFIPKNPNTFTVDWKSKACLEFRVIQSNDDVILTFLKSYGIQKRRGGLHCRYWWFRNDKFSIAGEDFFQEIHHSQMVPGKVTGDTRELRGQRFLNGNFLAV